MTGSSTSPELKIIMNVYNFFHAKGKNVCDVSFLLKKKQMSTRKPKNDSFFARYYKILNKQLIIENTAFCLSLDRVPIRAKIYNLQTQKLCWGAKIAQTKKTFNQTYFGIKCCIYYLA